MIHANSLEACAAGKGAGIFGRRCQEILAALAELGEATDREVCGFLGLPDMNCVRPRITELIEAGAVEESGARPCPITGRNVRIVRLKPSMDGSQFLMAI